MELDKIDKRNKRTNYFTIKGSNTVYYGFTSDIKNWFITGKSLDSNSYVESLEKRISDLDLVEPEIFFMLINQE